MLGVAVFIIPAYQDTFNLGMKCPRVVVLFTLIQGQINYSKNIEHFAFELHP